MGQRGNASYFGVAGSAIVFDPEIIVLAALVNWVENGTAPNTMVGTKFVNDTLSLGIELQRRHCRYPQKNVYQVRNSSDWDSWACQ